MRVLSASALDGRQQNLLVNSVRLRVVETLLLRVDDNGSAWIPGLPGERLAQFQLFGVMEVDGVSPDDLGPPQRRIVLAALAVDAGQPVAIDTLVRRVWDEPPEGARRSLYTHVARLRPVVAQLSADGSARLVRQSGGYLLDIDPDRIDLHRFRRLLRHAASMSPTDPRRVETLWQALDLWRGVPLADLGGSWVERTRQRLSQLRLDALVSWAETGLHLGQANEVVRVLQEASADYPLVEPFTVVLMRALDAAGRGTEALRYYAALRGQLVDELGAEPGPAVRELHQALLRRNMSPSSSTRAASAVVEQPSPVRSVPAQLPPAVYGFTGRTAELAQLDELVNPERRAGGAVGVAVVSGIPGVGKTGLAVQWAHMRAGRFPDGQLYVDLGGYGPDQPVPPGEVLAGFLHDLGAPATSMAPDVGGRSAQLRSMLAGRRMLVLLDNAADVEQIRPLLHGARRVELDPLPLADGVALLRVLIEDGSSTSRPRQ
jgi:DNA-binding SARP family transcriptional activator